jgi:hypothetical protein
MTLREPTKKLARISVTKVLIPALFKDIVHKCKKLQRKGITHRAGQSRVLAQH